MTDFCPCNKYETACSYPRCETGDRHHKIDSALDEYDPPVTEPVEDVGGEMVTAKIAPVGDVSISDLPAYYSRWNEASDLDDGEGYELPPQPVKRNDLLVVALLGAVCGLLGVMLFTIWERLQ